MEAAAGELEDAQAQDRFAGGMGRVSDALRGAFSRRPVQFQNRGTPETDALLQRQATADRQEDRTFARGQRQKQLDLDDPASERSRMAREMFAGTEAGKEFMATMGKAFERLPASQIPGVEYFLSAAERRKLAELRRPGEKPGKGPMDPTDKAYKEALTEQALANADKARRLPTDKTKTVDPLDEEIKRARLARLKAPPGGAAAAGGGRQLPASEASMLGQLESADAILKTVSDAWDTKAGDAYAGISKIIPATAAKQYGNTKLAAAQTIGTILEEGKLTNSDLIDKYLPLMPDASDTKATKAYKVQLLTEMIQAKRSGKISGFKKAGYQTSGFEGGAPPVAAPGGDVEMIKPDGQRFFVAPDEVDEAEERGWKRAAP